MYLMRGVGIHRISSISSYFRCIPRVPAQRLESVSAQVELRNDGLKYTEVHWNTYGRHVSHHNTRNTLEYTEILWNTRGCCRISRIVREPRAVMRGEAKYVCDTCEIRCISCIPSQPRAAKGSQGAVMRRETGYVEARLR